MTENLVLGSNYPKEARNKKGNPKAKVIKSSSRSL